MRVVSVEVENCKSYRTRTRLDFDRPTTVIVGPNGGGKSNTLDILGVLLRKYFRGSYHVNRGDERGLAFADINQPNAFHPIREYLDRNLAAPDEPSEVLITVAVGASDVENLNAVSTHLEKLRMAYQAFRNTPGTLPTPETWGLEGLEEGERYTYAFRDGEPIDPDDPRARGFRRFMESLGLFALLAPDVDGFEVKPSFVFYPPYRSAAPGDTRVSLAGETFLELLFQFNHTTSRTQSGAIKMASAFFAEKRRRLETAGGDLEATWLADTDVALVSKFLSPLGYSWRLNLIDRNKNTYQVVLSRNGNEIDLGKASSGEKEVINFLLGIAALRTRGGLIVVDEPELHLHPRWQGVVRDLLISLAEETENQVVLSTHSPVFVTPQTLPAVMRISRHDGGGSHAISFPADRGGDPAAVVHMINSLNNERLFFCDEVLLVEGIKDRVVMEGLIEFFRGADHQDRVVEVVEVGGKGFFDRYTSLLDGLEIPWRIMADLDYGVDLEPDRLSPLMLTDVWRAERDVLKNKKSKDRVTLVQALEEGLEDGDLGRAKEVWGYIKGRYRKLRNDLTNEEQADLAEVRTVLRQRRVYVLNGEIEQTLPPGETSLARVLALVRPPQLGAWVSRMLSGDINAELLAVVGEVYGLGLGQLQQFNERNGQGEQGVG